MGLPSVRALFWKTLISPAMSAETIMEVSVRGIFVFRREVGAKSAVVTVLECAREKGQTEEVTSNLESSRVHELFLILLVHL